MQLGCGQFGTSSVALCVGNPSVTGNENSESMSWRHTETFQADFLIAEWSTRCIISQPCSTSTWAESTRFVIYISFDRVNTWYIYLHAVRLTIYIYYLYIFEYRISCSYTIVFHSKILSLWDEELIPCKMDTKLWYDIYYFVDKFWN